MDIGLALERLMGVTEYGSARSYDELVRTWRDERDVPSEAELQTAWGDYLTEQAMQVALEEVVTIRRDETLTRFQQLTAGLNGLSTEDRAYAITARIMAHKDGANNATIAGITDKATAQAYVTGKPEWTAANATTRALVGDVLETMAGVVQVALLVME